MRARLLGLIAVVLALALAAPASAAPDRTYTLSRTATSVAWESQVNVAEGPAWELLKFFADRCSHPAEACDDTLLLLANPGTLSVSAQRSGPLPSGDVYTFHFDLYRSDATGKKGLPVGRRTGTRHAPNSTQQVLTAPNSPAGYYLVRVTGEEGVGFYSARATLSAARR